MRKEVSDFYKSHDIPVNRMVRVGINNGLAKQSIIDASEKLYDEIQGGLDVKPIRLAWEVWDRASLERVRINPATLSEINEDLKALKSDIESLKDASVPWYKKLWRKIK